MDSLLKTYLQGFVASLSDDARKVLLDILTTRNNDDERSDLSKPTKMERELIKEGKLIAAMRLYRDRAPGCRLMDAKHVIVRWRDEMGMSTPTGW